VAERFEHSADLPVPALVNRQLHDTVVAANCNDANLRPGGAEIAEAHATVQRANVLRRKPPGNRRPIGLLDPEARVEQMVGEFAVVGQQENPTRIVVEASDRHGMDAARKQVRHRPPSLRIAHRRYHPGRLVDDQVGKFSRRLDDAPFDFNTICRINESPELTNASAVDSNRAFNDQLVGMSPRRNPAPRQIAIQTNAIRPELRM
jgi:hypothetical protein